MHDRLMRNNHRKPGPRVLLITGQPATGKTTLAQALAATLVLPLVCRDQIKETLADTITNMAASDYATVILDIKARLQSMAKQRCT